MNICMYKYSVILKNFEVIYSRCSVNEFPLFNSLQKTRLKILGWQRPVGYAYPIPRELYRVAQFFFFFFFSFLAVPTACGNSWARDGTCITAVT